MNPAEAAEQLAALRQQQELLTKLVEQQEQVGPATLHSLHPTPLLHLPTPPALPPTEDGCNQVSQ